MTGAIQQLPPGFQPTTHGTHIGTHPDGESQPSNSTSSSLKARGSRIKLDKSNILLLGPTGCGKRAGFISGGEGGNKTGIAVGISH